MFPRTEHRSLRLLARTETNIHYSCLKTINSKASRWLHWKTVNTCTKNENKWSIETVNWFFHSVLFAATALNLMCWRRRQPTMMTKFSLSWASSNNRSRKKIQYLSSQVCCVTHCSHPVLSITKWKLNVCSHFDIRRVYRFARNCTLHSFDRAHSRIIWWSFNCTTRAPSVSTLNIEIVVVKSPCVRARAGNVRNSCQHDAAVHINGVHYYYNGMCAAGGWRSWFFGGARDIICALKTAGNVKRMHFQMQSHPQNYSNSIRSPPDRACVQPILLSN